MNIKTPLAKAVHKKGITFGELATLLGVSPSYVSQWSVGKKKPPLEAAQRTSKLLGEDMTILFPTLF